MKEPKIEFIETKDQDDTIVQGVIVVCEFQHENAGVARDCAVEFIEALLRTHGWWEKYWSHDPRPSIPKLDKFIADD
jgi:hypothetical protein